MHTECQGSAGSESCACDANNTSNTLGFGELDYELACVCGGIYFITNRLDHAVCLQYPLMYDVPFALVVRGIFSG